MWWEDREDIWGGRKWEIRWDTWGREENVRWGEEIKWDDMYWDWHEMKWDVRCDEMRCDRIWWCDEIWWDYREDERRGKWEMRNKEMWYDLMRLDINRSGEIWWDSRRCDGIRRVVMIEKTYARRVGDELRCDKTPDEMRWDTNKCDKNV